eukprot:jgi/Chrzof1/6591/Cz19g01340.t1
MNRYFCSTCGTSVFCHASSRGAISMSPVLFPGFPFEPECHIYCSHTAFNLVRLFKNDGLPKYKTRSKETGGDGELLNDDDL